MLNTATDGPSPFPIVEGEGDFSEKILSQVFLAKILLKRFWWIFLITISFGLAVQAYKIFSKVPVYASTAEMIVSGRLALPEGAVYSEELSNFFGTQIALMESSQVKERAASRVLALKPNLKPSAVTITVEQSPEASIFILHAYGENPAYTQAYLDATMQEYINFKREMRMDTADRTFVAINEEVLDLQQKIQQMEDKKLDFQKKNNIVFIQQQGDTVGSYLAKLYQELSDCQTQLSVIQTMDLDRLDSGVEASLNLESLGVSKDYFETKEKCNQLQAEYEDCSSYMKPQHPYLEELRSELDHQKGLLDIYKKQSILRLGEKKDSLQAQIKTLKAIIAEQEVYALDYSKRLGEFERINSRLERQKKVLDQLLSSIQSIHLNLNLEQESVAVLENASTAVPVRDNVANQILGGALVGLMAGAACIAAIGAFNRRIVSIEDVTKRFEEPVMGMVPHQPNAQKGVPLLRPGDSRVILAEACRSIRSSLLYAGSLTDPNAHGIRAFLITSSVPGEGKSTISANLAITLAFTGAKTILVDGDLRRGHLHKQFAIERSPGWAEVLSKKRPLDECIQKTETEYLDFIPCGEYPDRPGELLMSAYADEVITELKNRYEYVLFDTAPVLATDDTLGFAKKLDGVIFIVRSGQTRIKEAQLAFQNLFFRHIKVSGIVLNGVDARGPGTYYYRYQDYYSKAGSTRPPFPVSPAVAQPPLSVTVGGGGTHPPLPTNGPTVLMARRRVTPPNIPLNDKQEEGQ